MTTPKNTKKEVVQKRREIVSYWLVRGLTVREIAEKVRDAGVLNTTRGKDRPFTYQTIHNDIKNLGKIWQAEATKNIDEHKARQLAELRAALKVAWSRIGVTDEGAIYNNTDIGEIRRINEAIMKLLGTAAPTQTNIGGVDGQPLIFKGYTNVDPDAWPSGE